MNHKVPNPQSPNARPLFQILYELGLLGALLTFLLAPLHAAATRHLDVSATPDARHAQAILPAGVRLDPGTRYPVYRFHEGAKDAIDAVVFEGASGSLATFRFEPGAAPVARQGTIEAVQADRVSVNLGSDLGLAPGDQLAVFDGRTRVGAVTLDEVGSKASTARVLEGSGPMRAGMQASEFTIATQIVVFGAPGLGVAEAAAILLLLGAYAAGWARYRRSPLLTLGERLQFDGPRRERTILIANILLGPFAAWIGARSLVSLLGFGARQAASQLPLPEIRPVLADFAVAVEQGLQQSLAWPAAVILAALAAYYAALLLTRQSPFLILWRAIRFRGGPLGWTPGTNGFWLVLGGGAALASVGLLERDAALAWIGAILTGAVLTRKWSKDLAIWLLHLLIAYAFATALFAFIGGNLNTALATAWPDSGLQVSGSLNLQEPSLLLDLISSSGAALAHMATHAPRFGTPEAVFATLRYLLWTLTIVGCLIGYGHSILGALWGKRIRNLDFTFAGWITNGICYGPLLGFVVWQMVPPLRGADPILASGPLYFIDLGLELLLDIVYMMTIWNLGVMFGVMTDKGVRTTGFYAVVRHPSYTAEALMFVALELKALTSGLQWLAVCMFLFTYWLRSEREDAFMSASNPEFDAYREATPYKFIPGLY